MKQAIYKFKNGEAPNTVQKLLSSKFFPFITAAVTLISYYFGLDLVLFYYISIAGILILLLSDDVTPVIHIFLFMSVSVSQINTPSTVGNSDFYSTPEIYVQIFLIIGLFAAAAVYRLILTAAGKRFKLTHTFYGLCGLALAMILNGVFSGDYNPKNLLYGLIMAACFTVVFSVLKDNITANSECYEKLAYGFLAFSLLLVIELAVAYATTEELFVNGSIDRSKLTFGWGVYNTFGTFLVMCIPAVIFLAGRSKLGFVYTLYSFALFAALFFSCSRQAMVGGILIYPFCIAALVIKGKNRTANICVLSATAVAAILLIVIYRDAVYAFFKNILSNIIVNGQLNGSGRMTLWREAINNFLERPIFGKGFFVAFSYTGKSGLGFIPLMCHNTPLQLLSSCGIIGFAAYLIHRIHTVKSFFKNVTTERAFIAATVSVLLITCLFDNHIFNIFPTIIYSSLIAVLVAGEQN